MEDSKVPSSSSYITVKPTSKFARGKSSLETKSVEGEVPFSVYSLPHNRAIITSRKSTTAVGGCTAFGCGG